MLYLGLPNLTKYLYSITYIQTAFNKNYGTRNV